MEGRLLTFHPEKTIILAGAGISMKEPALLPGGRDLTEFCLKMAVGEDAAKRIQEIWSEVSKRVAEDSGFVYPFMRLEIILDNVNKMEWMIEGPRLLDGFIRFSERPENVNHRLLYRLAQKKSIVLTTNFDTCIENSGGTEKRLEYRHGCSFVAAEDGTGVYHLHGVAARTEELHYTLGATLENIKDGIDPLLRRYLLDKLEQSYDVIFVGYSGSDFFDILPFFESLNLESESRAVFFLHGTSDERERERVKRYIRGFKHRYILCGDTTEFLAGICPDGEWDESEECGGIEKAGGSERDDWKKAFQRIIDSRNAQQQAVIRGQHLIRLTNQIGIRLDMVDDSWLDTLQCVTGFLKTQNLEQLFGSRPDMSATILADLESTVEVMEALYPKEMSVIGREANGLWDEVMRIRKNMISPSVAAGSMTIERLFQIVEMGEASPYNFNSATVYAMNRFAKASIRQWLYDENDVENNQRLDRLERGLRIMLGMPYHKYMYMSYYVTLLKLDSLILAIRRPDEDNFENERRMFELVLEISNIGELLKVYLNCFRKNRLLYQIKGEERYFLQAEAFYGISEGIAQIAGMKIDSRENIMGID